jgi:hypothetical protein
MTINRRDFFVRGAAAIAAGALLGNRLPAASQTPFTKRNYLHVVEGTLGSDFGAGLFAKKA